uniref:Uncharacterized protein n=1 Tax=Macaca fascicularis TaxID=9541 RepID=Q8HXC7_MACFA|nr:hypothetical protein [Macaca fascicularis]
MLPCSFRGSVWLSPHAMSPCGALQQSSVPFWQLHTFAHMAVNFGWVCVCVCVCVIQCALIPSFMAPHYRASLSNLWPKGRMWPRVVLNAAQHKLVNFLKTLRYFFVIFFSAH